MKTPHKHAELIKAWADGAEIEGLNSLGEWVQIWVTTWSEVDKFRIKPEPKPDVVDLVRMHRQHTPYMFEPTDICPADLKLTFDGETGKLKAAEVIA
jgi:hypothetical protein